jgi:uncharacterized membrane protein YkoI
MGLVAFAALAMIPTIASADRRGRHRDEDEDDKADQAAAARARASGEIRPLTEIIDDVQKAHPGEIVAIELDRDHGKWIYEVKLVEPGGRLVEVYVDARDKTILKIEGK